MPKKPEKLSLSAVLLLVTLALGLGTYYRGIALDQRPMHADEAVLAMKLADFWEGKGFQYDPTDYHGPGLHYAAWLYGKLAGWGAPDTWTEAGLRHVPMVAGLLVLLSAVGLRSVLTGRGTLMAMLLTAVSPMMVFYSRYFIMEMLFVLLMAVALGAWWRWYQTRHRAWLLLAGAAIGFQHATKETFILNVAAAAVAWLLASWLISDQQRGGGLRLSIGRPQRPSPLKPWHLLALSAAIVSVTCYSAFFHDWQAVRDSVTTYTNYLQRAEGVGHEKPWHYYLTLLFWRRDGLVWTEALIGGLGLIGILHAFGGEHRDGKRQRFLVFLSLYTVILLAGYSVLAYKTPWSILAAQHGLILLAGAGAGELWRLFSGGILGIAFKVAMGLGLYHLCDQSMVAIGPYKADPRNPYVYAHTSTNLLNLVQTVRDLAALHPAAPPRIQVISRDQGWPLPWYFRTLPTTGFQADPPAVLDADIVIAEDAQRTQVLERLDQDAYQDTGLHGLRPGVPLLMLVRKDLWDQHMATRRGHPTEEIRRPPTPLSTPTSSSSSSSDSPPPPPQPPTVPEPPHTPDPGPVPSPPPEPGRDA